MKTNKQTLPKILSFLIQCQIDCKKIGRAWSPTGTESQMKVGHGRFNAAVECGYFVKNDDHWECKVYSFDLSHAKKVVEKANEYVLRMKLERELRGHVPTPRKKSTPKPVEKQPVQTEIRQFSTDNRQNVSEKNVVATDAPKPSTNGLSTLTTQQFVEAFKASEWIAECRRRGFSVNMLFHTKIEL